MASATAITDALESDSIDDSSSNSADRPMRAAPGRENGVTIYYLVWRRRPSYPWQSEEFDSRARAHQHYFMLIERGVEAYLERRWRTILLA